MTRDRLAGCSAPEGRRGSSRGWTVVERAGPVETLLGELADVTSAELAGRRVACPTRPEDSALVLGSSQDASVVDATRARLGGYAVLRRRSGGGAVLLEPGAQVWLDVFVPATDPLAVADVGRSAWWLGELWADACARALGRERGGFSVHRGALEAGEWSRVACFAGIGSGEVRVAGRKLVGISQRRDRRGAWLHSMALVRMGTPALADLLDLPASDRARLAAALDASVVTLEDLEGRADLGAVPRRGAARSDGTCRPVGERVLEALLGALSGAGEPEAADPADERGAGTGR
ncbi:MAG: hypothetical protein M0Z33_08635 [Actinomycetota bacterium]|nr:hypothetical protein [Actinomycetota bacterium]